MNVHPGGKQPIMRPGWYKKGVLKIVQHMVFPDGRAKGLRAVCLERFGEAAVVGKFLIKAETRGHISGFVRLSVCSSVCLSVRLSVL